jgi:hypothetical protein
MISQSEWKWFGYPLHYCLGYRCIFHLGTVVGDYLISTVGKQQPRDYNGDPMTCEALGYDSDGPVYFETTVWRWSYRKDCLCPEMEQFSGGEYIGAIEEYRYGGIDDCDLANKTHLEFCTRYATKSVVK